MNRQQNHQQNHQLNHQKTIKGEIPPPPLSVLTPGGDEEMLSYAEQQRILSEIAAHAFNRPVRAADWSNGQKDKWLSDAQPITRRQLAAVHWLYHLPCGHRVLEATQRRQSLEKLLEYLCAEIDKALTLHAEFVAHRPGGQKKTVRPEPDGWREAFVELWGLRDDEPLSFYQMTGTQQVSVLKKIRERVESESEHRMPNGVAA